MKVLVAGASSTVGVPAMRALIAQGHHVIGVTRTAANRRLLDELGAVPVVADALDAESIARAVAGAVPEVVVDLLTAVPRGGAWTVEDMEATNRLRTQGSANLLDAAVRAGTRRYVAESSYLVYGSGDLGEELLTEDVATPVRRPARVLDAVVTALAAKEARVLGASREGRIEGVVLRFGSHYGPGAGFEVLASLLHRGHLPVEWRSRGTTPWIHVEEAAAAIVAAVGRGRPGAAYNIAEDESLSFVEFLRCLAAAVGARPPQPVPGPVLMIMASYVKAALFETSVRLSNQAARTDLGWRPRFSGPREGVLATAAALDAHVRVPPKPVTSGESTGTVMVAITTNVVMVVAKAFAATLTGSPALFAETLHSLADTGNELLLLLALRRARHPADLRHPYGYGSELFFWSLLAALGIFLTGGVLSVWEGIQQLLHPGEATRFVVGYAVLGLGFVVDGTSWVVSLRQLRREARARGVPLNQHVRGTTDTTVTAAYLEDGAALLGGTMATIGLAAHQITGSAIPDALAAIAIGILLASIGLRLARRNRDLLTNLSESPRVVDQIRVLLSTDPEVARVGRVATMYTGPHQLLVTAEIQPVEDLSGLRLRTLIGELRQRVVDEIPRVSAVHLTPVVTAEDLPALTAFDADYWMRRSPDPEQA